MADRGLNATAASLLGLLHDGPLSGWDLVVRAQVRIGDFWNLTQSQVYRELAGMAAAGLVEVGRPGPRDRKRHAITDAGRAAFTRWIDRDPADDQVRIPLLLTIAFAEHLGPGRLTEMIDHQRAKHAGRLVDYQAYLPQWKNGDGSSWRHRMWHTAFVTAHATSATISLAAGLVCLRRGRLFAHHRWTLIGMTVTLAPVVHLRWSDYDPMSRWLFLGLSGLACYLVLRAEQARRQHPRRVGATTASYVDPVGFILIALANGFGIVAAIRGGWPVRAVVVVAVGVVVGHVGLRSAKARWVTTGPLAAPVRT